MKRRKSITLYFAILAVFLIAQVAQVPIPKTEIQKVKHENRTSPSELLTAKVEKIVDGDTVGVRLANNKTKKLTKVRFIGVNCPEIAHNKNEKSQKGGIEATRYTKEMLFGKTVYLERDVGKEDKYGRMLAYVWLEKPFVYDKKEISEKMFNAMLLEKGYAKIMTVKPNDKYEEDFFEIGHNF